jgi:hypothetical protein
MTSIMGKTSASPRGLSHRRVPRVWRRLRIAAGLATALAMLVLQPAHAQLPPQDPALFPSAAMRFLDDEMPRMEAAVRAGDRDFFEGATERMVAFSEDWDFKAHTNPDLAPYAACTAAVSDLVVVGLCRLVPGSPVCEPGLATQFTRNVAQCRQAAAR